MKNYLMVRKLPLKFREYVFLDTSHHFFDDGNYKEGIRLLNVKEIPKEGTPYRLISCVISSFQENRFLEMMKNIRYKALLHGFMEYDRYCCRMQELS